LDEITNPKEELAFAALKQTVESQKQTIGFLREYTNELKTEIDSLKRRS